MSGSDMMYSYFLNQKTLLYMMHFKSSLVAYPQLQLVNKFGNLNSINSWFGGARKQ